MEVAPIYHMQSGTLRNNGFKMEIVHDRDLPTDDYNTVRYEYYTRKINDLLSISVNYKFKAERSGEKFKFESQTVQLHFNGSFCPIHLYRMNDILQLINLLKRNDR